MKIKDGFMLREIAGIYIVVPLGERVVDFNGLLTLNETGSFLWKAVNDCADIDELVALMADEYDVDIEEVKNDVIEFFNIIKANHIIDE